MKSSLSGKLSPGYIKRLINILLWGSTIVYLFVLANLLLFKYISPFELFNQDRYVFRAVNLIPFVGIFQYLFGNVVSFNIALYNVLGNVLIFMPMGLLLQLMRPRQTLKWTIAIVCICSVAIEAIQFIMGIGSADVDDVILNTLGGLLGALIFISLNRLIKDRVKTRAFVAIIATVFAVVVMATQCKVWIHFYFREQIKAEWTAKYGMNLDLADIQGIYQSFESNIVTLVTDDGEILMIFLSDDTLISLVRRMADGTIDVFEPIDTEFLAELIEGLPIWVDLSDTNNEANKICLGDNPVDFEG